MFGYVKPLRTELKVKDDNAFRAAYCGLCMALKKEYGLQYRFLLNYDFVFLSMLLARTRSERMCRCLVHPLRKRCIADCNNAFVRSAAALVISSWWKLDDQKKDSGFWGRVKAGLLQFVIRRGYRKAAQKFPEFDQVMKDCMEKLYQAEKECCDSLDLPADLFASSLMPLGKVQDESQSRIYQQILYQMGRWIYIIDAVDDYSEDFKSKAYNPIRYRYQLSAEQIPPEIIEEIRLTLIDSVVSMEHSYNLLPENPYSDILQNVIEYGLLAVQNDVFQGNFHKKRKRETR